ncbi:MAG TPA: hypothetical protein VF730_11345 [Terracidiphilus sp.]
MNFRIKCGMLADLHARFFFVAAFVLFSLFVDTPRARAGEGGLTGYVSCTTAAPGNQFYVAGDPVYVSEIFHITGNAGDYQQAFRNFLKQKYGWTKTYINCPISYTKDGGTNTFNAQLKQAGQSVVRTGWTFANAGAGTAPATVHAAAAQNAATPATGTYFVCTWPTSAAGVLTDYVSDVNGPFDFSSAGPALDELSHAFGNFITSKYHPVGGSVYCVYQFSYADAEALKKRDLTTGYKGYTHIDTGWKHDQTAAASSPATTAPAPAPAAAAPSPTIPQPPATATIMMRLVDPINSANDQPGRQYRVVVTQAATAGSVSIPVNTLGKVTLAQSGGTWSTHLSSLSLNGQEVAVTSTSVAATSVAQQTARRVRSALGGFGGFGRQAAAPSGIATAIPEGDHVFLPGGTSLEFTTSVPQPGTPASADPSPSTGAGSVTAGATGPTTVPPQAASGGPVAMCFETAKGKKYVSAIFSAANADKEKAKWDVAFPSYVQANIDPFPGNSACMLFRSAAEAQHLLQTWNQAQLVETGWIYRGPESAPSNH